MLVKPYIHYSVYYPSSYCICVLMYIVPTFSDLTEIEVTSSSITAEWLFRCSGVFPLEQMTLRWRLGTDVEFPEENTVSFDYTNSSSAPQDGSSLSYTFQELRPATVYTVLIEGRNRLGTSNNSLFIIETSKKVCTYTCINLAVFHLQ